MFTRQTTNYGLRKGSIGASFLNTILIVLIIALVIGGVYFFAKSKNQFSGNAYQAVFLDNDQVYFGKVIREDRDIVELTSVYYLQVNSSDLLSDATDTTNDSFALVKLGNELHGPEDVMYIYREHILYIENLKSDSRVLSAIEEHQSR